MRTSDDEDGIETLHGTDVCEKQFAETNRKIEKECRSLEYHESCLYLVVVIRVVEVVAANLTVQKERTTRIGPSTNGNDISMAQSSAVALLRQHLPWHHSGSRRHRIESTLSQRQQTRPLIVDHTRGSSRMQ